MIRKNLSYKKIVMFIIMMIIITFLPVTVYASETSDDNHYQLIKEELDDGTILYSQEFTDGYQECISETRYYELLNSGDEMLVDDIEKYREELRNQENPENQDELTMEEFQDRLVRENRQETFVNDSLDVTEKNFEELIMIKDGDDEKYYILLTGNRYSEIDKTFYYYFCSKFQKQDKEDYNQNEDEEAENVTSTTIVPSEPAIEDVTEYEDTVIYDAVTDENDSTSAQTTSFFKIIWVVLLIALLGGIGVVIFMIKKNGK